jgi:hypothetical protein
MQYYDFELLATQAQVRQDASPKNKKVTFQVQVVRSPEGQDVQGVPSEYRLSIVEQYRKDLSTGNMGQHDLIAFGQLLADALFPAGSAIRDLLQRSLANVRARGVGLRLHLSLDRLVSNVPWECALLNLKGGEATLTDFLALMPDVSIVRHRSATYPSFPIEANLPAHLLVALASPTSMAALDMVAERATIEQALQGKLEMQASFWANATRKDLERPERAHVFHFSGHGTFDEMITAQPGMLAGEGQLVFDDGQQGADPVPADSVAINLRSRGVRVAMLNACQTGQSDSVNVWSSAATALLTANLGAVVGMQFRVGDASAIVFAREFYQALVDGATIDEAVSKGRHGVATTGDRRGWVTPVLYLNTPDGVVFPEFASSRELRMMQARLPKIEFDPFIRQHGQHFVGRSWLFKEIDDWLSDPGGQRYFLIKGEPGSGKTAIAARLCQFSRGDMALPDPLVQLRPGFLNAWHFCRVDESQWTNPQAFTKSLAHQLAERYFAFRQSLLQKMQSPLGELDFVSLVREPLNDLFSSGSRPEQPVVVLIDSLHEAPQEIVKLICQIQISPAHVRFIVTSWPQTNVLEGVLETDIKALSLSDARWSAYSLQDVREYAVDMANHLGLARRLARGLTLDVMADAVRDKSEGNFLYAYALLKALEKTRESITAESVKQWPTGLNPLYQVLLPRLLGPAADWPARAPVVGTLAVAQAGLREAQIAGFVGQTPSQVRPVLSSLRPFLDTDETLPPTRRAYEIYHRSFADFVLNGDLADTFWCEEQPQHQRIAGYYLSQAASWATRDKNDCSRDTEQCLHYGLRYTATHLARAAALVEEEQRHELASQLVALVTDPDFKQTHRERLNEDWNALQEDLARALTAAVDDRALAAVPLVVRAALANIAFTREYLNPRAIFDKAHQGDIAGAERHLLLFNCEPMWLQAALLTVAWQTTPASQAPAQDQARREQAIALRDRVAPNLADDPTFRLLGRRLDVTLGLAPMPDLPPLPDPPTEHDARTIIANLGSQDEEGMRLSEGVEPVTIADDERVLYLAERDAPLLVSFAYHSSQQGNEQGNALFDEYLAIQGSNSYVEYRNETLSRVLNAMLAHPSQTWLRDRLPALVSAVLSVTAADFQEGVPLTVLAMRAAAGIGDAQSRLNAWWKWAEDQARALRDERGKGDSRGHHRRRLAALAECLATLPLKYDPASERIDQQLGQFDYAKLDRIAALLRFTLDLPRGYAGYQSPACLTLAESVRVCRLEQALFINNTTLLQSAFFDAHKAAHNIQDSTFCARSTARYNAMKLRWWGPGGYDPAVARTSLLNDPQGVKFAALHILDEDYGLRNPLSDKAELPSSLRHTRTLEELAAAYQRPLSEFERLNQGQPQNAHLDDRRVVELINVPDPKFAPYLAARFAAEALVADGLSPQKRAEVIQSLVPLAMTNPTALDTVLMRLLLAAFPLLDTSMLEILAQIAPIPERKGAGVAEGGNPIGVRIDSLGSR